MVLSLAMLSLTFMSLVSRVRVTAPRDLATEFFVGASNREGTPSTFPPTMTAEPGRGERKRRRNEVVVV
jgi:hypothetical protein